MFVRLEAPRLRRGKRVGRGPGSGKGKTCGKGHKGQKARSGGVKAVGFEGGQMPLYRRLPKRGFVNEFRIEYQIVHTGRINELFEDGEEVSKEKLLEKGLIKKKRIPVKLLVKGEIDKKLIIKVDKASKNAIKMVEEKGGKVFLVRDNER